MKPFPCTARVITEVERLTNRLAYVVEDPSLMTLAHIQVARGGAPLHLLRYKPGVETPPDYLIAVLSGWLERMVD